MNKSLEKAIQKVYEELRDMPEEEFNDLMALEHGDIGTILLALDYFEIPLTDK